MVQLIQIILCGLLSMPTWADDGGTVGNGGDHSAMEFVAYGYDLYDYFQQHGVGSLPIKSNKFLEILQSTRVETVDELKLNGATLDAVNYPDKRLIQIDRDRWLTLRHQTNAAMTLVLHEYLWIMGIDDSEYKLSHLFWNRITARKATSKDFSKGFVCTYGAEISLLEQIKFTKMESGYKVEVRHFSDGKFVRGYATEMLSCQISPFDGRVVECEKMMGSKRVAYFSSGISWSRGLSIKGPHESNWFRSQLSSVEQDKSYSYPGSRWKAGTSLSFDFALENCVDVFY